MEPEQSTFPAAVTSVPAARRFVTQALAALGADGAVEDAQMLVSELATNAVLHARSSFTVQVSRTGDSVRVGIRDLSRARPRVRDYGTDSTTGRGLRLVGSVAVEWGVTPHEDGKTVWFELPAQGSSAVVAAWDDDDIDVDALLAGFDDDTADGQPVARCAA